MAERILTRCGYRCDLCLAYRPNITKNPANQKKLSAGWSKYFGLQIEPVKIICDGCMAENPVLIDADCPVRPCVIERGIDNCAHCDDYVCAKLEQRLVGSDVAARAKEQGATQDDYCCFIQPYENTRRLAAIRAARDFGFL